MSVLRLNEQVCVIWRGKCGCGTDTTEAFLPYIVHVEQESVFLVDSENLAKQHCILPPTPPLSSRFLVPFLPEPTEYQVVIVLFSSVIILSNQQCLCPMNYPHWQ